MSYDSHIILQEVSKSYVKVNVIPNELEKYMAFTINNNLVFIDSMQFMNSSLDALVNNLSDNDFKFLSQEFSGDLLELVKQKGVYPYENMDSFKKFSEDKLPDRFKLFSSLKDECIEKDYSHAINVSNTFKINAMDDYHDLHLKTDVMLLAVFEKFISTCLEYYGLDPCHCFSSLPYSGFKRLNQKQIDQFDVNSIGENSSIGYIYKKLTLIILMNYMNCRNPEKLEISDNMLSNYCSNIANECGIKLGGANKLVSNLGNKGKYVLHYKSLQLYLSLGMKLVIAHKILKF